MNSIRKLLFLQYPRKARGQVTVAATVTAIMTNHCSSQKEKHFHPSESRIPSGFSAASNTPISLFKGAHSSVPSRLFLKLNFYHSKEKSAKYPPSSAKGFLSRNTLEVQPSFRNSLLNTVHICKPQSAIYFILPSAFIWFQCPVA